MTEKGFTMGDSNFIVHSGSQNPLKKSSKDRIRHFVTGTARKQHTTTREGDEKVCSCGLRWDIGEDDPHDAALNKRKLP